MCEKKFTLVKNISKITILKDGIILESNFSPLKIIQCSNIENSEKTIKDLINLLL